MANRKNLKKDIREICDQLFTECLVITSLKEENQNKALDLFGEIYAINDEFITRISHTEPGNAKKYYKKLYTDFNNEVQKIIAKLQELA